MRQIALREVCPGDFVRRKPDSSTLIKGHYDRSVKKFSCTWFDDCNREIFLKSTTLVWVDFEF